jgi:hypothetical protein
MKTAKYEHKIGFSVGNERRRSSRHLVAAGIEQKFRGRTSVADGITGRSCRERGARRGEKERAANLVTVA